MYQISAVRLGSPSALEDGGFLWAEDLGESTLGLSSHFPHVLIGLGVVGGGCVGVVGIVSRGVCITCCSGLEGITGIG